MEIAWDERDAALDRVAELEKTLAAVVAERDALRVELPTITRKLGYLVRDYPGDKETRVLIERLRLRQVGGRWPDSADPHAWQCQTQRCPNEARYTSGYCGLCDIAHNGGRGTLRSAP